ncbi:MAG: ribosome recycling factor [Neisseriaceae bacterium]|nr:MAG: ribosome recycling factor [Neisseriaceae bacterium]
MLREVEKTVDDKMTKTIEVLKDNLTKVRTGRAHVGFLDQVEVDYYGGMVRLSQVANVTLLDSRTLGVKPYEKNMLNVIEKAIRDGNLGLNPASSGDMIRVPMPMLTEETRKEMTKIVKSEGEGTKIAIRNIRREANNEIKNLLKDKDISEDDARRSEESIQKITDQYINEVASIIEEKEKDLLEL